MTHVFQSEPRYMPTNQSVSVRRHVAVLGAGAFGTALATLVGRSGHNVDLYCRTAEQAGMINETGMNRSYFPGYALPKQIVATNDLDRVLTANILFLAFPANQMDGYVRIFATRLQPGTIVINLVKGLHEETFTFAALFAEMVPQAQYASLKGPTFARPLLHSEWSGLTCGTSSPAAREVISGLLRKAMVDLDFCASAEAVDAVSAMKNVYAIILGIAASIGLSENTTFLMISRIVKEIGFLMEHLGYGSEALFCHCGLGDTLLTGLCDTSRNRTLGFMIGKGIPIDPSRSGFLAEGARAVTMLHSRISSPKAPLLNAVLDILNGKASPISILNVFGDSVRVLETT